MKKLLAMLIAAAFAGVSFHAVADDMKKDTMSHDGMKKDDGMSHDSMKKDDGMKKN